MTRRMKANGLKETATNGIRIECADALAWLPTLPADSVDACVTDPPYGLSREPDAAEVLRHWLAGDKYEHGGGGFMGRAWDSFVPGPEYWREVYRVLKPGGHLLAFGGTRTADLLSLAIRLAGFEKRDEIDSISWVYGNGFPKSLDVSKALDKAKGKDRELELEYVKAGDITGGRLHAGSNEKGVKVPIFKSYPVTDAAWNWQGWGTALKPAHEPILVFRKPCSEPTVAANVLKHGTGAIHVDAGRIACAGPDTTSRPNCQHKQYNGGPHNCYSDSLGNRAPMLNGAGRWPANVVLTHHPDCRRVGTQRVRNPGGGPDSMPTRSSREVYGGFPNLIKKGIKHADPDGLETVDAWECVDGCVVKALGEQSGELSGTSFPKNRNAPKFKNSFGSFVGKKTESGPDREPGTAARFFAQFETTADDLFRYVAKASRAEREAGLDGREATRQSDGRATDIENPRLRTSPARNPHPTVKPLALLRYLVRLVTPPGGTVLDPFAGSGTTAVACAWEGFRCLACDLEAEYAEIARARAAHALREACGFLFAHLED